MWDALAAYPYAQWALLKGPPRYELRQFIGYFISECFQDRARPRCLHKVGRNVMLCVRLSGNRVKGPDKWRVEGWGRGVSIAKSSQQSKNSDLLYQLEKPNQGIRGTGPMCGSVIWYLVLVEQFTSRQDGKNAKWKERKGSCQPEEQTEEEEEVNGEGCAWHQAHPAG